MSGPVRLLLSARDPGGAGHVLALIDTFRRDCRFEVSVTASGVALRMLRDAGVPLRPFSLPDGREYLEDPKADPSPLLAAARQVLDEVRPDAVISSLSSFGVGVDEALLATADVPTFAMQDFWGDVNLGLGVPAWLYFVLDEEAVRLTQDRWGVQAVAVGSPKHTRYSGLDVLEVRRISRKSIGVGGDEKIVGFFGQSPEIPGHEAAFRELVTTVAKLRPRPRLCLREHPKFGTSREAHMALARRFGLDVTDISDEPDIEPWLAACDVLTTTFSACGLDHAYLSAYSPEPIGCVVYLLCNAEIRAFVRGTCGMERLPIVERGIGQVVEAPEQIRHCLESALSGEVGARYFAASKSLRRGDPCQAVVEKVSQALLRNGG